MLKKSSNGRILEYIKVEAVLLYETLLFCLIPSILFCTLNIISLPDLNTLGSHHTYIIHI